MKIGIYLSGLRGTFSNESVEKYARRFARQYDFHNQEASPTYEIHVDKFEYEKQHQLLSKRVVISEITSSGSKVVYKFYEYSYSEILTRNFRSKNALVKCLMLFTNVCSKLPLMFYRLFYAGKDIGYQPRFRGQTFYLFLIFFIISLGILFLLPTAIAVLLNIINQDQWLKGLLDDKVDYEALEKALKIIINFTALIILVFPAINNSIISLACEFVSASNYLERGRNKQKIHGQIDILIERIVEEEGDNSEIYFHSYSFGTLICLDYIFPFGLKPSTRLHKHLKGLITIGCPMEFIKVYFPKFLTGRNIMLNNNIKWINIFSLADALGSNFRKQNDQGPAEYSFQSNTTKPINIQYEVSNTNVNVITQFFTLHALKAHSSYWDYEDDGQNCFRDLIPVMKDNDLL